MENSFEINRWACPAIKEARVACNADLEHEIKTMTVFVNFLAETRHCYKR